MVIALVVLAYALAGSTALRRIDLLLYDHFLQWQAYRVSDQVLVVAIDDLSLQRMGRWPWSRAVHADLLDRLTAMGARAVAYDVLFSEPQTDDPAADPALARAIQANGATVLAVAPSNPPPGQPIGELLPLPELAAAAAGLGHVDIEIDSDGLCRRFYLHGGLGDARWPSLGMALLRTAGIEPAVPAAPAITLPGAAEAGWRRHQPFLIPFDPRPDAVPAVSAHAVLDDPTLAAQVRGRLVLVGSTATGLGDVVTTPVSFEHRRMPGVELNAHILSGLLDGTLAREIPRGVYEVLTVAIAALVAVLMVSVSFPAALLLFLFSFAAILLFAGLLLGLWQLWFAPAAAIAPMLVGFPLWGAWVLGQQRALNRSLAVRVQHQALHHATTDLPNQSLLTQQLRELRAGSTGAPASAMLMIVHLKWSGSAGGLAGGSAGDQLLRSVAQRLSDAVRSDDLVAHLCGDDFGILIRNPADNDSALRIARNLLGALQEPIELDGSKFFLTPRMGLSLWPKDNPDSAALLRNAYIAMFRARIEQSARPCVYSDEIALAVQHHSRLEQALIHALERDEFEVYYQPQVITRDGRIAGVEALLRWHNPELGLVLPGTFIPVAEHCGLITAIGSWVLRTACAQVQRWNAQGLGPLRVAVNLSALQFTGGSLIDDVQLALGESGLAPRMLELEITESTLMHNMQEATQLMQLLKARGITFAIDDFGTGYSSLSNLRHLPLDRIKIDQSFTRELNSNQDVREIMLTIIGMAKRLKLDVIAEGVESQSQAQFLGDNGCDELQGFYFGLPLPEPDMRALLQERAGQSAATSDGGTHPAA